MSLPFRKQVKKLANDNTSLFSSASKLSEEISATAVVPPTAFGKSQIFLLTRKPLRTQMDPDYYYLGRCSVSSTNESFAIGSITVTATCDSYKYKLSPTMKEFNVSGSLSVTLQNDRMPTVPMVTTNTEITV